MKKKQKHGNNRSQIQLLPLPITLHQTKYSSKYLGIPRNVCIFEPNYKYSKLKSDG
ncbi:MAG: hypothetical protein J1E37_06015 [Prevotella sp.]|nr:hypothetical protein [Prevotella sp.]